METLWHRLTQVHLKNGRQNGNRKGQICQIQTTELRDHKSTNPGFIVASKCINYYVVPKAQCNR